jgi:Secretion system C-terminal sorting domain
MATGSFVLQYNGSRRGESIFAQEPSTTESTIAQEPSTTESTIAQEPTTTESTIAQEPSTTESTFAQELVMMDITGKVVFKTNVVVNGNPIEIKFGDLASGVYVVMVGDERLRLIVE